ncbi:MAG: hypothetical protein OXG24_08305 [Gammaproteobacteria bacterium]|nr:hypothetical protein [Gammaproteobacteria bacterium]
MDTPNRKPALIGIGSFLAASLGVSVSASIDEDPNNVFLADAIGDSTNILSASHGEEGECGEGKCGEDSDDDSEGECGEGKCGEDSEGECGEGKCGDDEGEDDEEEEETEEE